MKVCVCDICQASEKDSVGGLFLLKDEQVNVDICGMCAASVLAATLTEIPDVLAIIKRMASVPIASIRRRDQPRREVSPIDDNLEKFIAESSKELLNGQASDKQRIDQLTANIGEQVFIEQFGQPQRIGAAVKIGMKGRNINRRVEIIEAVPGKPDCYFVFQLRD